MRNISSPTHIKRVVIYCMSPTNLDAVGTPAVYSMDRPFVPSSHLIPTPPTPTTFTISTPLHSPKSFIKSQSLCDLAHCYQVHLIWGCGYMILLQLWCDISQNEISITSSPMQWSREVGKRCIEYFKSYCVHMIKCLLQLPISAFAAT